MLDGQNSLQFNKKLDIDKFLILEILYGSLFNFFSQFFISIFMKSF